MSKITRNILIWQLPMSNPRIFRPVMYDTIDIRDYVLVYTIKEEIDEKNIKQYLEELYGRLSIDEPKDYHARSMRISDLVLYRIPENHEIVGYVVDLTGFKKVKVMGFD